MRAALIILVSAILAGIISGFVGHFLPEPWNYLIALMIGIGAGLLAIRIIAP